MIGVSNYYNPCLRYANFYFSKLEDMKDNLFGCLNPLLVSIYHQDSKLLKKILNKHGYPRQYLHTLTPIEMCHYHNQFSCLDTICSYLINNDLVSQIHFTKKEFQILLESRSEFCHQVLGQILVVREDTRLHNFAFLPESSKISSSPDLLHFLVQLQSENKKKEENISKTWMDARFKQKRQKNNNKEKMARENSLKFEVDILHLPFEFDFSIGCLDSLKFLMYYSESKSKEFILSEWKSLIFYKWGKSKYFWFVITFLYFLFLFLSTMVIVFREHNIVYTNLLYAIISFFIIVEIIEVISYIRFNWKRYILNISNWFDWLIFCITLFFPLTITMHADISPDFSKILGIITLTLGFYRGFSYLRVFDYFDSFVGIIREVFSNNLFYLIERGDHPVYDHHGVLILPYFDSFH